MARSRNTCLFMLMAYLRIKPPRPGLEPWTRHRRPPLPRDLSILGLLYVKEGICNNKKKREIGEKENLNESLVLLRIVLLGWTCCTRKNWEMGWMLCRGGGAVGVWLVNNWFPWINLFLSYHPPLEVYRSYLDQWKKSIQRPTLIPQRRQVCTMQQWMPHVGVLLPLLVWFVLRNGLDTKQKLICFVLIHQRRCCQVEHISLGCYKIDGGVVALVLMFEELGRAEGFVRRGARWLEGK